MLKKIKVEQAIGFTLGHDMTKVVPGECKVAAFRRGHIIKDEDIPELLSMGKEHIYVIEEDEGEVHEEEAACRLARAFAGPNLSFSGVKEGRIDIVSHASGLLRVNAVLLNEINRFEEIVIATRHNNTVCQPGMVVGGTKIIPLYIADATLRQVEELCHRRSELLRVLPFKLHKVGVVVTGSEVYKGRIKDKFVDVIEAKVKALGAHVHHQTVVTDDEDMIAQAILNMKNVGCEIIFACGGLSVDPDDVTVEGVKRSGARIISYGAPVMPGVMLLAGELNGIPIIGAPAAVIWNKATVVDLILPRLIAGEKVSREDIVALGHGGLCLGCQPCTYPICPFCK